MTSTLSVSAADKATAGEDDCVSCSLRHAITYNDVLVYLLFMPSILYRTIW